MSTNGAAQRSRVGLAALCRKRSGIVERDKTDGSNYSGISILPNTYKSLSNFLLPILTPKAEEIIGDHQCGFRRTSSSTDHMFCICQVLEKKCE